MIGTRQDMAALGEPESYVVKRDGDRDLTFRGWRLASGRHGSGGNSGFEGDWTRGVDVTLYLTTGGRLVVGTYRWTRWVGESPRYDGRAFEAPADALAWMIEDGGDRLGPASKAAWEAACARYAPLAAEQYEEVE